MEYYSHPNKLLIVHLREVAEKARELYPILDDRMKKAAYIAGAYHDFGKFTSYFQDYLKYRKKNPNSDHALLSAIVGASVAMKELDDFSSLLIFLVIWCHHSELKGLKSALEKIHDVEENLDDPNYSLILQIKDIMRNWTLIEQLVKENLEYIAEKLDIELIKKTLNKLKNTIYLYSKDVNSWEKFFKLELLFSSLIDADKRNAAGSWFVSDIKNPMELKDKILSFISKLRTDEPIQNVRSSLLKKALSSQLDAPVISIQAPTGSGKTLSGMITALRKQRNRVIYALPYINIIEQTYSVLTKAFESDDLNLVLPSHHLSIASINFSKNYSAINPENYPIDKLLLPIEAWDSQIIVTTFQGLLQSLITSKNSLLKKLHNIANSTIILDEVQALPAEYWGFIKKVLENASKYLNVNIILMTATLPYILRENSQIIIPDQRPPLRVKYKFHLKKDWSPEELSQFFLNIYDKNSSALLVLNTVSSAEEVYLHLKESGQFKIISDEDLQSQSVYLSYLSSRIVPKERKKKVEKIREALEKRIPIVLVSTQVIEAGVDLDFNYAIRDIGPLDSIIQVAGRCNRNGRMRLGRVDIVRIVRESGKTDFSIVYGQLMEEIMTKLLNGLEEKELGENEMNSLLEKFYKLAVEKYNVFDNNTSNQLVKNIENLCPEKINFQLIEQEPKYNVFIELDNEAEKIRAELISLILSDKWIEKPYEYRAKLKILRAKLEEYVVSVWENPRLQHLVENFDMQLLSKENLNKHYNRELGFRSGYEDELIIL